MKLNLKMLDKSAFMLQKKAILIAIACFFLFPAALNAQSSKEKEQNEKENGEGMKNVHADKPKELNKVERVKVPGYQLKKVEQPLELDTERNPSKKGGQPTNELHRPSKGKGEAPPKRPKKQKHEPSKRKEGTEEPKGER
ncbi:MAG: hypothetical protein ABEH38_05545 [Flavobacteriales bacterium]